MPSISGWDPKFTFPARTLPLLQIPTSSCLPLFGYFTPELLISPKPCSSSGPHPSQLMATLSFPSLRLKALVWSLALLFLLAHVRLPANPDCSTFRTYPKYDHLPLSLQSSLWLKLPWSLICIIAVPWWLPGHTTPFLLSNINTAARRSLWKISVILYHMLAKNIWNVSISPE